jgi:hypothetical protein
MTVRFIVYLEPGRGEPLGQFAADRVGDAHAAKVITALGTVKRSVCAYEG